MTEFHFLLILFDNQMTIYSFLFRVVLVQYFKKNIFCCSRKILVILILCVFWVTEIISVALEKIFSTGAFICLKIQPRNYYRSPSCSLYWVILSKPLKHNFFSIDVVYVLLSVNIEVVGTLIVWQMSAIPFYLWLSFNISPCCTLLFWIFLVHPLWFLFPRPSEHAINLSKLLNHFLTVKLWIILSDLA